jgi:hypothetical protein
MRPLIDSGTSDSVIDPHVADYTSCRAIIIDRCRNIGVLSLIVTVRVSHGDRAPVICRFVDLILRYVARLSFVT